VPQQSVTKLAFLFFSFSFFFFFFQQTFCFSLLALHKFDGDDEARLPLNPGDVIAVLERGFGWFKAHAFFYRWFLSLLLSDGVC